MVAERGGRADQKPQPSKINNLQSHDCGVCTTRVAGRRSANCVTFLPKEPSPCCVKSCAGQTRFTKPSRTPSSAVADWNPQKVAKPLESDRAPRALGCSMLRRFRRDLGCRHPYQPLLHAARLPPRLRLGCLKDSLDNLGYQNHTIALDLERASAVPSLSLQDRSSYRSSSKRLRL